MIFSIHTFELTLENIKAYDKWRSEAKHNLHRNKEDIPTDYSLFESGISVKYDDRHKKKIRLIVNPSKVLGGDDLDLWKPKGCNCSALVKSLNTLIDSYFRSDYGLNDFRLTRVDFTVNIDVGSQTVVSAYIKVLHNIGKVKGFKPKYGKNDYADRINKALSFDLAGNSNGIGFTVYDKQAQLEQLLVEGTKDKGLKHRIKMASGILRVEVRLERLKAIHAYVDKTASTSKQIKDLAKNSEKIFMETFQHIVPHGDYYKKKTAEKLVRDGVSEKTLRRKMLRLLELIPEKKSLLLAQKKIGRQENQEYNGAIRGTWCFACDT